MLAGIFDLGDQGARLEFNARREAAGDSSPFSSLTYADAAAEAFGLCGQIHVTGPESGALILLRGASLTRRAVVPPFTQYSALALPGSIAERDVHARTSPLERILESVESVCRRADLLCRVRDPRPAKWRGWQVSPLHTYILPTASDPACWSESARRIHRTKSPRYECCEAPEMTAAVIELCRQSYARHGRRMPGGSEALLEMVRRLQDMVRVFVAFRDGTPHAGIVVLHEGSGAHYWISGSQPGPAMTVLIGHVLRVLQAAGIGKLDLVGANTPSIAEFKRRFAPRLDLYYHLRRRALARLFSN